MIGFGVVTGVGMGVGVGIGVGVGARAGGGVVIGSGAGGARVGEEEGRGELDLTGDWKRALDVGYLVVDLDLVEDL